MNAIKDILLWNYPRTALRYDVLCLLILAFIFLTPKGWFENRELTRRKQAAQRGYSTILLETSNSAANPLPLSEIEQRVRRLTNHPDTKVVAVREKREAVNGPIVAYEVDIR